MRGVSEFKQHNTSQPIYIGYIIVPSDVNRDKFVKECYNRERVSILVDRGGGIINNCYIDKDVLQHITFPTKNDEKSVGSAVVYVSIPTLNLPFIIATFSAENDTQLNNENTYQIKRENKEKISIVTVNGNTGEIVLNSIGAGITLICAGDTSEIILKSLNNIDINANKTLNLGTNFSNIQVNDEKIEIIPKKRLNLFSGSEPLVLGNKNKDVLTELKSILSILSKNLVTYASSQSIITGANPTLSTLTPAYTALITSLTTLFSQIEGLVSKINITNSEKSYTD